MKLVQILTLFIAITTNGQTSSLHINPDIILLKDSNDRFSLINSLDSFLKSAQKPDEENKFVLGTEKIETYILLDEMSGIENSDQFKDSFFYKPYLTNVVLLSDSNYLVQLSYIGIHTESAFLGASFELIAHRVNSLFLFSSPLIENTKYWKVEKTGNNIFHYQSTINKTKTKEFTKLASSFDAKLKVRDKITEYYCCDNLRESENLMGIEYKSAYNGQPTGGFNSSSGNRKVIVLGDNNASFDKFDPHDLFHDRLSLVIERSKVNHPVDEGCAYLYGGSWGLPWKEIFKAFKEQVAENKNTSWTVVKESPVYFKTNGFRNSADYIVNALLVQKIEKEKGFAGVWELLNVGPYQKGNENYYAVLEKLTGITKADYNDKVWELINNQQ